MDFAISQARVGEWVVIAVSGEVDMATGPSLRDDILAAFAAGNHRIVLDLSAVTFMDSSGLGALLGSHRRARLMEGEIKLAAPSSRVQEILRLTNLDRVFDVHPTVAEATGDGDEVVQPEAS